MDLTKRRKQHLSTLGTARLLSGLMLIGSLLLVLCAIALPPWREVILQREAGGVVTDLELFLVQIPEFDATIIAGMLLSALLLAWGGYVLRILAALVETQLMQFPSQ